jgi:hypothetical protein
VEEVRALWRDAQTGAAPLRCEGLARITYKVQCSASS